MTVSWSTHDALDVPPDTWWLTARERERLAALRIKPRRDDWLLGRWTAKRALGVRLGAPGRPVPPGAIEIRAAADGAPEAIVGGMSVPWTVSISHRAGRALCAVAPARLAIGCDLEWIVPRDPALVADFFAPREQEAVARASACDRPRLVALLWSAKESALKAMRTGLREDPRDLVVELLDPGDAAWHPLVLRRAAAPPRRFDGWWRQVDDFVLTIAVERSSAGGRSAPPAPDERSAP